MINNPPTGTAPNVVIIGECFWVVSNRGINTGEELLGW